MSTLPNELGIHEVLAERSTETAHHDLVDESKLEFYAKLWQTLLIEKEVTPTEGLWRVMVAGIPKSANGNDRLIHLICPDKGKIKTRLKPPEANEFARLCYVVPPSGIDANQIFDILKAKTDKDIKSFLEEAEEKSGEPFTRLYREEEKFRRSRPPNNLYREQFDKRAKAWDHHAPITDFVLLSSSLWQTSRWLDRVSLVSVIKELLHQTNPFDLVISIEIYYLIEYQVIERDGEGYKLGKVGQQMFEEVTEKSKHRMPQEISGYLNSLIDIEKQALKLDGDIARGEKELAQLEEKLQTLISESQKVREQIEASQAKLETAREQRSAPDVTVPLEELIKTRQMLT